MKTIRLKDGKERSLLRGHPWVFAGSIARGGADLGETVRVEAADGRFLAWGAYSPESQIRVRAWSFVEAQRIDAAFFAQRIRQAVALRAELAVASDGVRLVHGEADGLPGLVVDRYGDLLSAQFLAAGAERWREVLVHALIQAMGAVAVYERSDASVRGLEGLPERRGWLHGEAQAGGSLRTITEHAWRLQLDVATGHKTGFYLDQRDNRAHFARSVRHHGLQRVLNCYCYSGGFSVAARLGGATEVTSVDASAPALALARENLALNGQPEGELVDADVNAYLRAQRQAGRRFDAIVLDPPKFAATVTQAERAARAYKDINLIAFQLLRPGGLLYTFSCSGGVSAELFHKIVAGAAIDAGVDGAILARLEGASDHPTTMRFPEGAYLKGLVVRVAG